MSVLIFILAGREEQAKDWAHSQGLKWREEARYLFDERVMRGIPRGQAFVRVGTWHYRTNMDELEALLVARGWVEVSPTNVHEYLRKQA